MPSSRHGSALRGATHPVQAKTPANTVNKLSASQPPDMNAGCALDEDGCWTKCVGSSHLSLKIILRHFHRASYWQASLTSTFLSSGYQPYTDHRSDKIQKKNTVIHIQASEKDCGPARSSLKQKISRKLPAFATKFDTHCFDPWGVLLRTYGEWCFQEKQMSGEQALEKGWCLHENVATALRSLRTSTPTTQGGCVRNRALTKMKSHVS